MPYEYTLLSDTPASPEVINAQGKAVLPVGALLVHANGEVYQYVDGGGRPILSVFESRHIRAREHVDRIMEGGSGDYEWWTDLTIPYGDSRHGVALTQALAVACGGRIAERI